MAAFRWRKENLATKFALQFRFLLELGLQGFFVLVYSDYWRKIIMKTITITVTDDEYAHLESMLDNEFEPNQTLEEFVLEVLADSLPYLRLNHWPQNKLVDYNSIQSKP